MPTKIKLKRRIGKNKSVYEERPGIMLSAGEPLFDDVGGILYIGTGSDNIGDLYESGKYFIRGVDGVIVSRMLSASAVTTDKINNAAVTTDKIANSSVTADKIGSSAVTTAKVANSAITLAKLDTTGDTIPASITTIPAYIDKKISDAVQGGVSVTAQNIVITEDGADKTIISASRTSASSSKASGDVILSGFNLGQYYVTGRTSGTDYTASDMTVVSKFKATQSHTIGTLGTQSFYIDTFSENAKAPFWISANKFSVRKLDGVMTATDPSIVFTGSQGNVVVTNSYGTLTTVPKLSAEAFITGGDTSKVLIGGANGVSWKPISSLVPYKSSYADSAGKVSKKLTIGNMTYDGSEEIKIQSAVTDRGNALVLRDSNGDVYAKTFHGNLKGSSDYATRVSNALTIGSTTYDGSSAVTIEATIANTENALVKRDANGNFSAGIITASLNGTATKADSADSATRILLSYGTADASRYVYFGTPMGETYFNDGIKYNPSTKKLTVNIVGNASSAESAKNATLATKSDQIRIGSSYYTASISNNNLTLTLAD